MKIAFVVHDYHRHGGHARYVAELACRFKQKHEVHVYASVWEEPNPEGITFHWIPSIRWTALTSIISFFFPALFIPTGKFDIVHSQGFCGLRQDIVTAHICNQAWYEAAERIGGRLPLKKKVNKWIINFFEKITFRKKGAKKFIAVSERIRKDLLGCHGLDRDQVVVVYHGVDLATFGSVNKTNYRFEIRQKFNISKDDLVFLYVGDWQKAGLGLLKALAKMQSGKLLIISKTDFSNIKLDLKDSGVAKRVLVCPPTKEIEKFYAASDVFVFPSYYDSFGMVVTEAMASGLPVITNKHVGASEIISDGVDGFLTKNENPWDPQALCDEMAKFISDRNLSRKMGDSAILKAKTLTWDKCACDTMNIYEHILRSK